jgi:hypothetical protein
MGTKNIETSTEETYTAEFANGRYELVRRDESQNDEEPHTSYYLKNASDMVIAGFSAIHLDELITAATTLKHIK